jgi:DNA ligase D-like protein (predicted 3'-phosphoesterase)
VIEPHHEPLFVIQKHASRALHYDFRLEVAGVLKSWAVPKGPSLDPRDKRLAVSVEDHALDYAYFEGVIPEGQYGAGAVIVWDLGTYRNTTERSGKPVAMETALEQGRATVRIDGQKLQGGYSLIRTAGGKRWLLVKMTDEFADPHRDPVLTEPQSVLSGKTIEEMQLQSKVES